MRVCRYSLMVYFMGTLIGQPSQMLPKFEVGGGINYLNPRQYEKSGWGMQLHGVWNLSFRYGMNVTANFTKVDTLGTNDVTSFNSIFTELEMSFRAGDIVYPFTILGIGIMSVDRDPLYAFGAGIKIPLGKKLLFRVEIRDLHSEFGIPYVSFPGGRVAFSGLTASKYFTFGLSLGIQLGEKNIKRDRRFHHHY